MPVSIIVTHWSQNEFRSECLKKCLTSLIETTKNVPAEIIVVDNGASLDDSSYILNLCQDKKIQHYVRNSENLYFGYARNQGYDLSCGEYLVFSDNDIVYKPGWLEKSLEILEAYPDKKIAVTPLRSDRQHRRHQYWQGELQHDGKRYLLNMRAGSNSWVMRRKDFDIIGRFRNHRVAGSKWTDSFVNKGYLMVTMEDEPLAVDTAFKKGYNFHYVPTIKKVFTNQEELIINS